MNENTPPETPETTDRDKDEGGLPQGSRPAYPTHKNGPAGEPLAQPHSVVEFYRMRKGVRFSEPVSATDDPLGEIAGPGTGERYVEGDEIARGGMGSIVKLFDRDIRRPVAMKVILEDEDPERVERFIEEAQITGQLEHPNIIPVYEIGVNARGKAYFTMKLVRGESLEDLFIRLAEGDREARERYPLTRLIQIFLKVCDAVAFAHSRGIVHRDLKPENVMVGRFGEVLVMDWGLSKVLSDRPDAPAGQTDPPDPDKVHTLQWDTSCNGTGENAASDQVDQGTSARTLDGEVMGSPSFMPPEQASGKVDRIDERSDVWALGAILYGVLCQEPPHAGDDILKVLNKAVLGDVVPPSRRVPWHAVPSELEAVCMRCMARHQEDRYPSVEALIEDVQAYLERRLVSAYRYGLGERISRWVQRHPAASVGMGVATVLLAFGATLTVFLVKQAEIARIEAEEAQAGQAVAEAKAETALTLLEKGRRVSAVLRGAGVELKGVYETLVRTYWAPIPTAEKRAIWEKVRLKVQGFEKNIPDDTASRASWLALKGWLRRLAGYQDEAMELFRRSREADRDVALGLLFEGMHWLSWYMEHQPLPMTMFNLNGIEFLDAEGETAEMAKVRGRWESILEKVREAGVWGDASAEEFASVLAGFQGMQRGDFEEADRGLSGALNVPEMAFLTVDLLVARAKVRHRLTRFEEGIEDLETVRELCPDNLTLHFFLGELWQGEGMRHQLRGEDPRPALKRAIEAHTQSIELVPYTHLPYNGRGSASLLLAGAEMERGCEARPILRRAVTDFTEAIRIAGPKANLLSNRGSALRTLATIEGQSCGKARELLDLAEKDLLLAIRLAPGLWYTRNTLAKVYGLMGEDPGGDPAGSKRYFEKAMAQLEAVRRMAPDRVEPSELEGMLMRVFGDMQGRAGEDPRPAYRRAIAACREALERANPSETRFVNLGAAQANLAKAMYLRGESGARMYEEALRSFDGAISANPMLTRAYMNKIVILTRRARFEEARATLREMEANAREPADMNRIKTSREVVQYATKAPQWMIVLLEAHQLYNGYDYPNAGPRYEKAIAMAGEAGIEKTGTIANLLGIARFRLGAMAALASEGKAGPLAEAAQLPAGEAEKLRNTAVEQLRKAMELWPPLLLELRKSRAFASLAELPAFRALVAEWEKKR